MSVKSMFSAKGMTQGAPWKRIMEFSIPMLLGNVTQQLYNTADSVITFRVKIRKRIQNEMEL